MSREFELVTDYQPAGDQPQAIAQLIDGINSGLTHQTLLGVTGSGKTFTMANVIQQLQRPAIIMAHNKTLAAQLYGEMKEFFPRNSVQYFVSYYDYYQPEAYVPASDTFIEKDASINDHIEQMRLSATKSLLERRDTIIVASVSAIYGLGDPDAYLKMLLHVVQGDLIDQRKILRRLAELQYTRNDIELKRGTYRVRGDVIDIHPADSERDPHRRRFRQRRAVRHRVQELHPDWRKFPPCGPERSHVHWLPGIWGVRRRSSGGLFLRHLTRGQIRTLRSHHCPVCQRQCL